MHRSDDDLSAYNSPDTAVPAIINDYYNEYITKAIEFLRKNYSDDEISTILTTSLTEPSAQFRIYLENSIDYSNIINTEKSRIKAIFCVLQRILTGTLTREDRLLQFLLKVAPLKKVEELNVLVKQQITIPLLLAGAVSSINKDESHTFDSHYK